MGTYLYNISSKKRKMVGGEEVRFLKFLCKPAYGVNLPPLTTVWLEKCLGCFGFEQAEPVYEFEAGYNYWLDSDEGRKKQVGNLLREGRRFKLVDILSREEGMAYELLESVGNDSGGTHLMSNQVQQIYGKDTKGFYWFEVVEGNSSEGPKVWSKWFKSEGMSYMNQYRRSLEALQEMTEVAAKLRLKEAC
jgi:hypothetical protein